MNQNVIEKQSIFLKQYFNDIDFNCLYGNFENLFNEYSESDLINSHLNTLLDKFFQLKKKDEDIKLVFNFDFLKSINIDDLITSYYSEKSGKREKFMFDLLDNNSLKTVITPKNSLYTRNILLFILLKYYKQIGADFDKPAEEKLYKFLSSEMNLKGIAVQNETQDIFSNHIQYLYKLFVKKYVGRKDENINLPNINNVNSSVRISNNLNDELANDNKDSNNIIIISNNINNLNNPISELFINDPREDTIKFLDKFLFFLKKSNKDSSANLNKNINLDIEINIMSNLIF
jgi:hypothetical protein